MNPCIYCPCDDPLRFSGREHVIQQAFGTFGAGTPTLNCVCDDCNAYFGRELDQFLARETWEGVTRYKNAKFSSEHRVQRHLRFTLADGDEAGEFAGAILEGLDPTNGTLMPLATQLLVQNKQTGEIDAFFPRDIGKFDLAERVYGAIGERRMQIYAPSKVEHDAFVDDLKRSGIEITLGERFGAPNNFGSIDENGKLSFLVQIEGEVNDTHKRALAKILINFAAHFLGYDEVQKAEWTAVKRYVRYGEGKLGARFSEKPFWNGQETDAMRLASDSINIRLENHPKGLVGALQFYNHPIYELLLIESHNIGQEIAYRFTPGSDPLPGQRGDPALKEKAG